MTGIAPLFFDDAVLHNVVLFAALMRPDQATTGAFVGMNSSTQPRLQRECSLAMLDPRLITSSGWGQPDKCEFFDKRFGRLKRSINDYCGNLQPIKVRPKFHFATFPDIESKDEPAEFELVFGYARFQACSELGLPVLAVIERLTEAEALRQFFFEMRGSAQWRPWRLGRALYCGVETGLLSSTRGSSMELAIPLHEAVLLSGIGHLPESIRQAYGNIDPAPRHANHLVGAYRLFASSLTLNSTHRSFSDCRTASSVLSTLLLKPE